MIRAVVNFFLLAAVLLGMPLLGVYMAGHPVAQYLEFPPLTRYVEHAPFSWPVFVVLAALTIGCVAPFVVAVWRGRGPGNPPAAYSFPWWGWAGVVWTLAAWVIAWSRFEWMAPLQGYTFTPLWLGYIVIINALTFRRSGHCMLRDQCGFFALLFVASAAFWWFFEYLNRFVQNWYYVGVADYSPLEYFLHATLPFSTVLPAVLGTRDWLATFPGAWRGLERGWRIDPPAPRVLGAVVVTIAAAGLLGIGLWPDTLYSLLWVAPLLLIVGARAARGRTTIFSPVARGDWRGVWLAALAALQCGLFWEMWNYHSLAKWEYAVPFVHRFQLFEMPLLGYAGYLPFGLECVVVGDWLRRRLA